jgi:rhamnulokinase
MADYAMESDFDSAIDIMSQEFSQPGNMNQKIADHCRRRGQRVPVSREETYMSIMQGLVCEYSKTICQIIDLTKRKYKKIHIVGGGARNDYLCRLTATKTGMSVVAGPYEAAATGNILVQLIALGEVGSIGEARSILERSFELKYY